MSEFHKSLFQKRLKRAEAQLGLDFSEDAEETDSTTQSDNPALKTHIAEMERKALDHKNIDIPSWKTSFDVNEVFETSEGFKFNTYYKKAENSNNNPVVFVCHHGAGSSALTFGELSKSLRRKFEEKNKHKVNTADCELPGVFAFDMRGHAGTALINSNEYDYSMKSFSKDFVFVLTELLNRQFDLSNERPSIFLVGHSLGGSVLTNVISREMIQDPQILDLIKGLTMLDIVEEAAIQSLHAMDTYLDKVPKAFPSVEASIQWHIESRLVSNEESAKLSIPALFKKNDQGDYEWIAELYHTQPFWKEWFVNLSSSFVSIKSKVAKLLILSGHDNLDKYLMIGQMQGKYQLVVFQNQIFNEQTQRIQHCGHFIQEDCPDKVALTLIDFVERNDITRSDKQISIKWGSLR